VYGGASSLLSIHDMDLSRNAREMTVLMFETMKVIDDAQKKRRQDQLPQTVPQSLDTPETSAL
jgi:hypothetical protein